MEMFYIVLLVFFGLLFLVDNQLGKDVEEE